MPLFEFISFFICILLFYIIYQKESKKGSNSALGLLSEIMEEKEKEELKEIIVENDTFLSSPNYIYSQSKSDESKILLIE